jgi:hypothetical protein
MSSRALPLACLPETHHVFWDLFIPLWRASFNKIKWRPMMHCNHHHWGSYHGLCHLTASGHQLGKFDFPPPFFHFKGTVESRIMLSIFWRWGGGNQEWFNEKSSM